MKKCPKGIICISNYYFTIGIAILIIITYYFNKIDFSSVSAFLTVPLIIKTFGAAPSSFVVTVTVLWKLPGAAAL